MQWLLAIWINYQISIISNYSVGGAGEMKKKNNEPTIAPGMNDNEELEQKATEEEIKEGEYTSVTRFSWDEVDPS